MMSCTTLLFHSILYTLNNLTQKLGRGAELITTNYTTGWSLVHIIWTCNKETLYISVNYVFWQPVRLPQKVVHARCYLNQLYGNSSEQVSEWIRCFRLLLSFKRAMLFFMVRMFTSNTFNTKKTSWEASEFIQFTKQLLKLRNIWWLDM